MVIWFISKSIKNKIKNPQRCTCFLPSWAESKQSDSLLCYTTFYNCHWSPYGSWNQVLVMRAGLFITTVMSSSSLCVPATIKLMCRSFSIIISHSLWSMPGSGACRIERLLEDVTPLCNSWKVATGKDQYGFGAELMFTEKTAHVPFLSIFISFFFFTGYIT